MAERTTRVDLKTSTPLTPVIRAIGRRFAPHEDLYHYIMTISWAQFFGLAAFAFLVINGVFALAFVVSPGSISNARDGSFEDAFYFSVQTLGTIGYGGMTPATRYGHLIVTAEAIVGIFTTALITGMTFARFARPVAKVVFTSKAVIATRDGVPHLHFRMANWRHNQIVEAQLRVILLIRERTREGHEMRRSIELPLVRDRTALFSLTWIAMHEINETSPFYGPKAIERLRGQAAELFLSLNGIDSTIGQTINAQYRYSLDDIVSDAMFEDVLRIDGDGTRVIDYTRFHEIRSLAKAS